MTRKQAYRKLRQILLGRRDALRRTLHGELERFRTMDETVVGDEVDRAVDTDYGYINSQLAEAESRELGRIEQALQHLDKGTYGDCENCGKKIALTRLQALPYALHCIQCQRAIERDESPVQVELDWSRLGDDEDTRFHSSPIGVASLLN